MALMYSLFPHCLELVQICQWSRIKDADEDNSLGERLSYTLEVV